MNMAASGNKDRYLSGHYYVMSNHASELAVHLNEKSGGLPIKVRNIEDGVFLIKTTDVHIYYNHYLPTVLKYDKNTQTEGWHSYNFGVCKGMTFDRVLVFPNGPLKKFLQGKKLRAPEKYYVGVTRPRHSLAIVVDSFPNNPLFQQINLTIGAESIEVMRFIGSEKA
ncbi:MAG: hypothetical protein PHI24_09265 [Desulfitobacteriaceae bacterium]|nr:hypothetical protein [Desulfitobacteriaceae bacterium]